MCDIFVSTLVVGLVSFICYSFRPSLQWHVLFPNLFGYENWRVTTYTYFAPICTMCISAWRQEFLPVASKTWPEGQHRGSDHDSTRTAPMPQSHRGKDPPHQTGPKVQAAQRCSKTVQNNVAGCKVKAGTVYTKRHIQVAELVYRNIVLSVDWKSPSPNGTHHQQGPKDDSCDRCGNPSWQ